MFVFYISFNEVDGSLWGYLVYARLYDLSQWSDRVSDLL